MNVELNIARRISLASNASFVATHGEDLLDITIIPEERSNSPQDIADARLYLGENAFDFPNDFFKVLRRLEEPEFAEPDNPKETIGLWLNEVYLEHPELEGDRYRHMLKRDLIFWSKRKENIFSDIDAAYRPIHRRYDRENDVMGLAFKGFRLLIFQINDDGNEEGEFRNFFWAELDGNDEGWNESRTGLVQFSYFKIDDGNSICPL